MTHDEHIAEALRLLELCAASPDDPQAQCVAAWVRQTMDARPVDPFAARMRGLLSDYGLAMVGGDRKRQRESGQTIRMMIAAAMVPGSDTAHEARSRSNRVAAQTATVGKLIEAWIAIRS